MENIAWPLLGHERCEASFLEALDSNRLHHGWILEGPSGIGKALLARRMAAKVLGAQCMSGTLDAAIDDPIIQKLTADAHPDMRWIYRRPDEKGRVKQDIPVDAIRELNEFFSLKAGLGGWRVGIIDSLDELNRSCLLYTSPSPRDATLSRMPSSA